MFENIGGKIKTLAKVICWIGIVASVIIAIIMFASIEEVSYSQEGLYRGLGFAFLILGPLFSWISSFVLYGFGELIETNCEIARNTRRNSSKNEFGNNSVNSFSSTPVSSSSTERSHTWLGTCEMCNNQNVNLSAVKIVDNMGTRYRNVCSDCAKKYNCTIDRDKELDELLRSGLISKEEYDEKKAGK